MKRLIVILLVLSLLCVCIGCAKTNEKENDYQSSGGENSIPTVVGMGNALLEDPIETPEPERQYSGKFGYIVLDDGTISIEFYRGDPKELIIPDQLDGKKVTRIGDDAFTMCLSTINITIPDSVTSIGNDVFFGCKALKSINIPDSVTSIGRNPFQCCDRLTNIIVSPDHPYLEMIDGVLFSKPDKRLVCYPCTINKSSYVIPDGIQIIGGRAFYFNRSLTSVTIPDGVTSIEFGAFGSCGLTSISIPYGVTSIGEIAFYGCSLKSIDIPNSVTSIGDDAFDFCPITSITIPDSVTSMGCAFCMCTELTSIIIPDSLTSIAVGTFAGCSSLTSVSIPETVTSIGDRAFFDCISLKSITIPDSVANIGDKVFMIEQNWEEIINPYITITVSRASYAEQYCKDNNINYAYTD